MALTRNWDAAREARIRAMGLVRITTCSICGRPATHTPLVRADLPSPQLIDVCCIDRDHG